MKGKIYVVVVLVMCLVWACTTEKSQDIDEIKNLETEVMQKPDQLGMDKDLLDTLVMQHILQLAKPNHNSLVEEAVDAIDDVQSAIYFLSKEDKEMALLNLKVATGKLEILTARDPELAFVPIEVKVKIVDVAADVESIRAVIKQARLAMKKNYFQVVREEIANLASEIQITTVELPLATFPIAMKMAAALIEKDDFDGAKITLINALNTLVISEERIPLPILRAYILVNEANELNKSSEEAKEELYLLLENAEYQLLLAEELGYGKRDKEYQELYEALRELRKSIGRDDNSNNLFDSLRTKLSNFKERIKA